MQVYHNSLFKPQTLNNFINLDKDLYDNLQINTIGKQFENSLDYNERKKLGQFYTDPFIVQFMLKQLKINPEHKILDPTCGCGSFLLGLQSYLDETFGYSNLKNIYGVDLNKNAISLAQYCLLKTDDTKTNIDILKKNIVHGNTIVSNPEYTNFPMSWSKRFSEILNNGGFDYIIGNPPYGTIKKSEFDISESDYEHICDGRINKASLIMMRSLDLLKEGGKLAFLLPKSFTYVLSYKKLRQRILDNFVVYRIHDLNQEFPPVRGEQIILFLHKVRAKPTSVKISTHKNKKDRSHLSEYKLNYKMLNNNGFTFLENPRCLRILDMLDKNSHTVDLSTYVNNDIFRGLTLAPNEQKLIHELDDENSHQIIRGNCISKFAIKKIKYIHYGNWFDKNTTKIKKLSKPKITLQNIFSAESGFIAALDMNRLLDSDTVTNISIPNKKIGLYLLGILHSKLINFYVIFKLFNASKLTMHTDRAYIGRIPVLEYTDCELTKIVHQANNENNIINLKLLMQKIDKIVFELYGVKKSDVNVINNALEQILSRKSWW